jgi:predicted nucleic acid-binding protein
MTWLLDTNVLSEIRKGQRCHPRVARWVADLPPESLYTSVLVLGEIRRGVERVRRKDAKQAKVLANWLEQVRLAFAGRILEVTEEIAEEWGKFDVPDPKPVVDGLMAATAKVRGLTLVTRNTGDVASTGVALLNPFEA